MLLGSFGSCGGGLRGLSYLGMVEPAYYVNVCEGTHVHGKRNRNRIVIDCRSDLGTMHADQTRFRQALLNLASNANKFTENGSVTIAAQSQRLDGGDWIKIAVTDTGIGMTPAWRHAPHRPTASRAAANPCLRTCHASGPSIRFNLTPCRVDETRAAAAGARFL